MRQQMWYPAYIPEVQSNRQASVMTGYDEGPATGGDAVEWIHPNVTLEHLDGDRITVLTVTSIQHDAVDAWANATLALLAEHDPAQPSLMLHDVSKKNLSLTPYIRSRTLEMINARPEVPGRVAVVLPDTGAGTLIRHFINQLNRLQKGRRRRLFATREEALAWLREELTDDPPGGQAGREHPGSR
jgi:hypothetical protein